MKEKKSYSWVGWVITVLLSVSGALLAMNTRTFNLQTITTINASKIEQHDAEIKDLRKELKTLSEKNNEHLYNIEKSLIEINSKLDMKSDRKYIE